jgi:hypothetical protein
MSSSNRPPENLLENGGVDNASVYISEKWRFVRRRE